MISTVELPVSDSAPWQIVELRGNELLDCQTALDSTENTLRLLLIASTNFSVFALKVLAYTNFSDFLCLHNVIMKCKTLGRIHMQALDAGITPCIVSHLNSRCQGPTHIRYTRLYILRMRVRVPRSRVGPVSRLFHTGCTSS